MGDVNENEIEPNLNKIEKNVRLVKKIRANIKRSQDHLTTWRKMTMASYAFYGNDQWDEEDISVMEGMKKVPITFNRVTRTISAVMGVEASNRQAVMYYPRRAGVAGVSELLTGAADWAREGCDAEDEESQAFKDTLICGLGFTETRLDHERDRDGNVIVERRDPLEMGYDINARKDNLDDSKYFWRRNRLTKEEFREAFPNVADEIISNRIFSDDTITPHDATKEMAYKHDHNAQEGVNDNRDYHVDQYQWYEKKNYWLALDKATGEMVELEEYDAEKNIQFIKGVKIKKRIYKQAFIIGDKLLEVHDLPVNDFTFRAITGLYNRKRNYWFGLVELMKDPQMWANKWMTEVLYILRTNASGGVMSEPGAFINPQQSIDDWPKPNSHIKLTAGGGAKIFPKPGMGGYPDGMMNLLQFAIGAIQDVTGVNVEMLGTADRNQPIGLEKQRKEAGTGIMSPFFNALRRYHKEQGRVLAEFIIHYISDGRLVRISGEEGAKYVPLLKDELTFKYDIIVDESITNPDMKQKVFEIIGPMIPLLLQSGIPVPPEILDYFPIPNGLTEKWKEMLVPKEPTPEELQAQQEQEQEAKMKDDVMFELQMRLNAAEEDNLSSKAELNRVKAETERMNAANKEYEIFDKVSGTAERRKDEAFMKEQARRDLSALMAAKRQQARQGYLYQ